MKKFLKKHTVVLFTTAGILTVLSIGLFMMSMTRNAVSQYGTHGRYSLYHKAHAYNKLIVPADSVVGFSEVRTTYPRTTRAFVQVETNSIRVKWVDPAEDPSTGDEGIIYVAGEEFQIIGHTNILNFRAIGELGTSTCQVILEYEDVLQ